MNRIEQEEQRFISENERIGNEKARNSMEKIRISSEKKRIDNEEKRNKFFSEQTKEILDHKLKLGDLEKGRKEREQVFEEAEAKRIEGEKQREKNERRRNWVQQTNLKLLEDRKNKLDEIEMKMWEKEEEKPVEKKSFETFFTNRENTTEWIENPKLREKVNKILDNIENEEEAKPETFANALLDGIKEMESVTLTSEWEKKMDLEEHEKLKWGTRVKNLNEALFSREIVINPEDPNLIDFLRKNLKDSYTKGSEDKEDKDKIINGFFFQDKKIIKRNIKRIFVPIEGENLENFLSQLSSVTKNADSIFTEEIGIFTSPEVNREFAEDYIRELREEQREMIKRGLEENGEFFEMAEFNSIENDVEKVSKNKPFKIRPKIWAKSLGGFVSKFVRWVKLYVKNNTQKIIVGTIVGVLTSTIGYFTIGKLFRTVRDNMERWKKEVPERLKNLLEKDLPDILNHYLGNHYGAIIGTLLAGVTYYTRFFIYSAIEYMGFAGWKIFWGMGKVTLYFQGAIVGFVTVIGINFFVNYLEDYSLKAQELSYLMRNENPPEKLIEKRAEKEKMSISEYKKKFIIDKKWNSKIATVLSYPVSAVGTTGEKISQGTEFFLETFLKFLSKFGLWIGIGIIIIIIIKWR